MGAAIDALGDSIGISTRNPNLVLGGLIATVLLFGVGGVLSLIPLVGPLVANVIVAPIALAGMVAMANAAAGGSSSFGDFIDGISDHSLTLMGAFALLVAIQMALGIAFLMAFLFVGFSAMTAGAATEDPTAAVGALGGTILVVVLFAVLVSLAIFLVTQFLDVAVVVGDADATGSYSEAIDLVTSGPLSVLGYSILRGLVGLVVVGIPVLIGAVAIVFGADGGGTLPMAAGALVMLLALPVGFAVLFSYHVAYYRHRTGVTT